MTDTSYPNDRAPQIPGAEPIAPTVTVSGPPGWTGTVHNWSPNLLGRVLVSIKPDSAIVLADDLTIDDAERAIDRLLLFVGAHE